ncbi:hypothetical protein GGI64_004109 [Rhizobium leguminosarum]|uniref:FAD/NAD(P)-binding domain-containing protein n=1 Tax=Rhizobium leguminosarum TaxID=384 RepID=A0A7Z0IZU5_RHILE|nr:hypothetical protein [Rhizobium leguminosarum]
MAAKVEKTISKQIVDACQPNRARDIYCIGSFGHFVNFSAQQHRALNLAWALHKEDRLDNTKAIAVIGGGLTGVTLAAALVRGGYTVHLFEHRKELMAHQLSTDHRLVHPAINSWPFVPMIPSSSLPFLNWVSGPCSKVVSGLLREFEEMAEQTDRLQIFRDLEISNVDDGLEGLVLSHKGAVTGTRYGCVVLAVGFGDEKEEESFPAISYWHPDGIEHQTLTQDIQYFLVSGCGDGGLIDALRVIHRDFDKGGLIFETAYALDGTAVAEMILAHSDSGRGSNKKAVYIDAARMIASDPSYANLQKTLVRSAGLKRPVVRLSARNGTDPFLSNAAPVHKLMIAHAMLSDRILYSQGTLVRNGNGVQVGRNKYDAPNTKIVVRHGPNGNPIQRFCSQEEITFLRREQEDLEDVLSKKSWTEPYLDAANETVGTRAERLHRQAVRAIKLICPEASVSAGNRGFQIVLPKSADLKRIPHELFGIPVKIRATRKSGG